jgi:hypothetical protein
LIENDEEISYTILARQQKKMKDILLRVSCNMRMLFAEKIKQE